MCEVIECYVKLTCGHLSECNASKVPVLEYQLQLKLL